MWRGRVCVWRGRGCVCIRERIYHELQVVITIATITVD